LKDQQIIEGILNKENRTYSYIYEQYGGMITAYALKNNGSMEDGMELVQVTILKIWDIIKNGKYEARGKFGQFVYTVAANTWKMELRKRKRSPTQTLGASENYISDQSEEALYWKMTQDSKLDTIYRGINQLDDVCQELINLFHLEKVSLLEISKTKNYPYNNLKKRIFSCRKKLKKIVAEIGY